MNNTFSFFHTFEIDGQILLCALADLISENGNVQAIPHPATDMDKLIESLSSVLWRRSHEFGQAGLNNWLDDVLLPDFAAAEGLLVGAQITTNKIMEKLC